MGTKARPDERYGNQAQSFLERGEPGASARPMRSCARRARILPKPSSTADTEAMIAFIDDHRGGVWGRADLQGATAD